MGFEALSEIVSALDRLHASSVAPAVPWGLNPVAVAAIASSVSAVITASALIVAVRTYRHNSRAAARSQAALVTAQRMKSENIRIIDGVEHRLAVIQITNSSDADVFNLCLLLHSKRRGTSLGRLQIRHEGGDQSDGFLIRGRGIWELTDGAIIPPGVSTLRVYLNHNQSFSRIAVGFVGRNGRQWTRWLDGELVEGFKTS
jgi:hypothetical protein